MHTKSERLAEANWHISNADSRMAQLRKSIHDAKPGRAAVHVPAQDQIDEAERIMRVMQVTRDLMVQHRDRIQAE